MPVISESFIKCVTILYNFNACIINFLSTSGDSFLTLILFLSILFFIHEYCIYLILPSIPSIRLLPNLSNLKFQIHDLFFSYCLYVCVYMHIHACIHIYIYQHNLLSPFSMLNTYMYLGPTIELDRPLGGMSLRRLIPLLWNRL